MLYHALPNQNNKNLKNILHLITCPFFEKQTNKQQEKTNKPTNKKNRIRFFGYPDTSSWPTLNGTGRERQNFTLARLQYINKDQMEISVHLHFHLHKHHHHLHMEMPGGTRKQLSQWRTRFLNYYVVIAFPHLLSYKYLWDFPRIPEVN